MVLRIDRATGTSSIMIIVGLMAGATLAAACASETGSDWSHAPHGQHDQVVAPAPAPVISATPSDGGIDEAQYVTDVARGFELYQMTCAACHGIRGQGVSGPALNDQAKLFDALTPTGEPGDGYLNPIFLDELLTEGGSYVCGDPNSLMAAFKEPKGPLGDRQVEQLIAWITASSAIVFEHRSEDISGWRDPQWTPGPETTPVPACWQS
jgi:mono/diheme cytochrome c family protein